MSCCTDNQFIHKGDWDNEIHYDVNNMVLYNGSSFIAIKDNCNVKPITKKGQCYWQLLALRGKCGPPGPKEKEKERDFNYKGTWKSHKTNSKGDFVTHKG